MQLNLTLGVTDLQRSQIFYSEILELEVDSQPAHNSRPAFLLVRCGATRLVLQPLAVLEAQHPALLQNLSRDTLGVGLQLEFSCPDMSALLHRLQARHWPILYELEDQEHQRRELWLHDPDGYLLVLNEEQEPAGRRP
ncbi:VOC family protein [Pelobacter seleniigenes]|uniref:VOC family protein n=1 Tax=Pelobacter seleniigenes TaxID=407188 RepID=UPI0004A735DC|nr:VOC family protein [Pelobacter seleniigenes]